LRLGNVAGGATAWRSGFDGCHSILNTPVPETVQQRLIGLIERFIVQSRIRYLYGMPIALPKSHFRPMVSEICERGNLLLDLSELSLQREEFQHLEC
jgi:hypothetical protein